MSYVNSCEFLLITRNEQKKYKDNSGAFLLKKMLRGAERSEKWAKRI